MIQFGRVAACLSSHYWCVYNTQCRERLTLHCCWRKEDPPRTATHDNSYNSPCAREVSPYCRHDVQHLFILLR